MDEVERAGLWIGLIASVAGIVLSLVAIWFARTVDRETREVSSRTIQSLERIETTVERSSSDTSGLIKAAWDAMLGGLGGPLPSGVQGHEATEAIASGVAAELRADLTEGPASGSAEQARLGEIVERLERTLAAQLGSASAEGGSELERLRAVRRMMEDFPPKAVELAHHMYFGGHLSRPVYQRLLGDTYAADSLDVLRQAGLLVPLGGHGQDDQQVVYWFPPGLASVFGAVMQLDAREYPDDYERMGRVLEEAGYQPEARRPGAHRTGRRSRGRGDAATPPGDAD